jgi:hypothetical protein
MEKGFFTLHSKHFKQKKENVFTYEPQVIDRRTFKSSSRKNDYSASQDSDDSSEGNRYYRPSELRPLRSQHHSSNKYHDLASDYTQQRKDLHFHIPLHSSERVLITKANEMNPTDYYSRYSNDYYLSKGSQRQIAHSIHTEIAKKFDKAEKIIHSKLLKEPFQRWKDNDDNPSKIKQHVRYYYPTLYEPMHEKNFLYHRGITLLFQFLYFKTIAKLLKSFSHWKLILKHEFWMKRKFFDKWNIKSCLWMEQKMKMRRFLKLVKPVCRRVLLTNYWSHWHNWALKMRNAYVIKFVFSIWKLTIQAQKRWKQQALKKGLKAMKENRMRFLSRDLPITTYLYQKYFQLKYLKRAWHNWLSLYNKKMILKKFFAVYLYKPFYLKCWNKWKSILPDKGMMLLGSPPRSPMKYSPHEPSPSPIKMKKAVFQSANSQNEYRQVTMTKKKKTKLTINWNELTALQRIEYRMKYVKHMDTEFVKVEKNRHEYFRESLSKLSSTDLKSDLLLVKSSVTGGGSPPRNSKDKPLLNNNNNRNVSFERKSNYDDDNYEDGGGENGILREKEMKMKNNLLCKHSHDHCLYCNYCQQTCEPFDEFLVVYK